MYTTKLFLDDFVFRKLATELVGDVGRGREIESNHPRTIQKRMDGEYSFRFQFQFGRFESKASRRSGGRGRADQLSKTDA